jgi:hypothetical protein
MKKVWRAPIKREGFLEAVKNGPGFNKEFDCL